MRVDLPPVKRKAIQELDYGMNVKIMFGVQARVWRGQGYNGDAYTDEAFQSGFDSSELQPGVTGGYTLFLGGRAGVASGEGTAAEQLGRFLPGVDRLFPGVAAQYNGQVARAYWPGDPFVLGNYSTYGIGQTTSIGGAQFFPVGNLHFAGEHCDHPDIGFMDGAARTGRLAALGVLASIRR